MRCDPEWPPDRAGASPAPAAGRPAPALLGWLLAEPALEPGDPAAGVQNLLLAGVERVAIRADVGVNLAVPCRAPGGEAVPARTGHLRHHVLRVDVGLHVVLLVPRSPGRPRSRAVGVNRYRTRSAHQCATSTTPHGAGRFPA